jgi:hypothetical protein
MVFTQLNRMNILLTSFRTLGAAGAHPENKSSSVPYLIRAREVVWFYSAQFLESRVCFSTVDSVETVTLPAPTTKGGIKKLLKELRGQILEPSRTQISHDLRLQSKDELDVWSETGLSRLGSVFLSATSEILKRTLVDETGVWLIAQMTSPDSRAQKGEDPGRNQIHQYSLRHGVRFCETEYSPIGRSSTLILLIMTTLVVRSRAIRIYLSCLHLNIPLTQTY